ncbi:MAG: integrase arm-type DNA-binding domain-containing protein [Methylomonas sp.]|jgi:integrase|uniref:tyrosine-type recombinase/integrase n=1 Tax=Methylomonas sp. TaxID=418 RepID=UPI0025D99988|nr:site-specific integrase [Methylomonas sp.]MCK9606201.1 integrase arm-type DNA-binding domain-containing protein [Methylomonas sp.]
MFTDKSIRGLKPKESAYRLYEKGADKGFGVKVTPAGSVSFFIQYAGKDRKQKFHNLGRYPSVSLSEARNYCRDIRSQIDQGQDPSFKTSLKHGSVADLFEYYIKHMIDNGKRTWKHVEADLQYNCQDIMHLQAKDITSTHIRKILHNIISRGSKVQSNRVRSYLHRAFELGVYHDNDPKNLTNDFTFQITTNPVDAIPKDTSAEVTGNRNLSFAEIRQVWLDTSISEQFHLTTKLLIIYGCRMWELCGALKQEFDFDTMIWSIPPERVKNQRWLILPITPLAKKLLDRLWIYSGNSRYLLPGRFDENTSIHNTSLNHAIRKIKGVEKFSPRDLRRTVKTRMGEIGIDKSIRDRIQNHALTDVSSKHYDRYDYLPEKKTALLIWEKNLIELTENDCLI